MSDAVDLLTHAQAAKKVSGIIIAIGVNDAIKGNSSENLVIAWGDKYEEAIRLAKQLAGNKVALLTILPVERGKSLGDEYFSTDRIRAFNSLIKALAKKHNVILVDQHAAFGPLYDAQTPFTTDGVHLDLFAYQLMRETLRKSVVGW